MNLDLEDAIKKWLVAREQCSGGCRPEKCEPFTHATKMMYAAFSEDWQGDERTLHVAFQQLRMALVADGDRGHRHLEVSVRLSQQE